MLWNVIPRLFLKCKETFARYSAKSGYILSFKLFLLASIAPEVQPLFVIKYGGEFEKASTIGSSSICFNICCRTFIWF